METINGNNLLTGLPEEDIIADAESDMVLGFGENNVAPQNEEQISLDVDGNGVITAETDGLQILRYMFGHRGDVLIRDIVGVGATRNSADEITAYLNQARNIMLDVDGNGIVEALNDGVLILRFLSGFTGEDLTRGAIDTIDTGATRTTAAEIEGFLDQFNIPATDPGNTLDTALDLGTLSESQTLGDFVGNVDTDDFYQFAIDTTSRLNIFLEGLTADADVELIQDINNNGIVDAGELLGFSFAASNSPEAIELLLSSGNYFVRVYQFEGDTNYDLSLSATSETDPGNDLNTALDIGTLSDTQTFSNFVGNADPNDVYRFSLDTTSNFSLDLGGLDFTGGDINVRLIQDFNSNGIVDDGEVIAISQASGSGPESIDLDLGTGTYFVDVFQFSGNQNYDLSLSATVMEVQLDGAGNSLSEAADLGTLSGTQTQSDFVGDLDANDFYRFNLDTDSNFRLDLDGLSADADVRLIEDINNNGVVDEGEVIGLSQNGGNNAEVIDIGLTAGTYFVEVFPFSGNTDYNLNLSAISIAPADGAGNSLSDAADLGTLSGIQTQSDFVGDLDANDFYRLTLDTDSNFRLDLDGLSADADVRLIEDINNNGVVDEGEVIGLSQNGGNNAEVIDIGLTAGTYFVEVFPFSGNTDYNLSLSAISIAPADGAGNSLSEAADLETLSGSQTQSDFVGNLDVNDFYRFNLDTDSNFRLDLDGLTADADVELIQDINNNGVVDEGELIASSTAPGDIPETINAELGAGTYFVRVFQFNGNTDYNLSLSVDTLPDSEAQFESFTVVDASGDSTPNTVFEDSAIRFSYEFADPASLSDVRLEALRDGTVVETITTATQPSVSNQLINLNGLSNLTGGDYQLRAVATTTDGEVLSTSQPIRILSISGIESAFGPDTLTYNSGMGTGTVVRGRGGTDTLSLNGVNRSDVMSINGLNIDDFNPLLGSTDSQAIFGGIAFDYLALSDGREIYFNGIENLEFADRSTLELQVRTNDALFDLQWNLRVSDVESAWRFTQGSEDVLLVSLDSGILTAPNAPPDAQEIFDIDETRLFTDITDDDDDRDYGHGHSAISIMASTPNNGEAVTGINWNSNVFVQDLYGFSDGDESENEVNLLNAIDEAVSFARTNDLRVVFQGGIQGESWLALKNVYTQEQLEQSIEESSDIALFAIAAGNGGIDIDITDPIDPLLSGGVARLEGSIDNVIAVGALRPGEEDNNWFETGEGVREVNDLTNAISVDLAEYSNRGSNLTLVAATDSPATTKIGDSRLFGGTSAANPNMAGIASLVWSVNPDLTGGELRQILIDTAMDLGAAGRDNRFGNGLVNADAAVRRAFALDADPDLASLYTGDSLLV